MKQLPINSTSKHPKAQVQPGMTDGHNAGEIPSATHRHALLTLVSSPDVEHSVCPEHSRWEVLHPKSNFRNLDDCSDLEQVEYSERPYLSDEKWFV